MEQPLRKRSERSDKGRVRENRRDIHALTWLAQMYGAPLDVLAKVLDTSEAAARKVVQRWEKAGWAHRGYVDAGPEWVWPTTGMVNGLLPRDHGGQWGAWRPSPMMAAHVRAVAETRLVLAGTAIEGVWTSERELAHREHGMKKQGMKLPHISDGVWLRGGPSQKDSVLIEVELTAKHPTRVEEILRTALDRLSRTAATEVWYVCGSARIAGLVTRVAQAHAAKHNKTWPEGLRVMQLDELIEGSKGRDED
jgi:hypothetical protein